MLEVADSADMILQSVKMKQTYESSYGIVSESLVNRVKTTTVLHHIQTKQVIQFTIGIRWRATL